MSRYVWYIVLAPQKCQKRKEEKDMTTNVILKADLGAYPDLNDPHFYRIEGGCAIMDLSFLAEAYEMILMGLAGDYQAEAFLKYTEKHEHGTFVGDGYTVEF